VRHTLSPLAQRGHLLTAFAVVAAGVWLAAESARTSPLWSRLRGPLAFLGVLLALQVALGVEAWLGRFAGQILPELQIVTAPQAVVRTLHVLLGSGILATSVVLSLRLAAPAWVEHPGVAEATPPESRPITALREPQLEGTA
jgi:hypothetical protein